VIIKENLTDNYRKLETRFRKTNINIIIMIKKQNDLNGKEGTLIIPDISGFTDFVANTSLLTGQFIVKELLTAIIDCNQNNLEFSVSEIEGDAVLFYKFGPPPSVKCMIDQYESMIDVFEAKKRTLSEIFQTEIDLSIKIIVHHGRFLEYSISNFKKLYGSPVIEAHNLLKNHLLDSNCFILMTDAYINAVRNSRSKHGATVWNTSEDTGYSRLKKQSTGHVFIQDQTIEVPGA
jgi:hypothetical protein